MSILDKQVATSLQTGINKDYTYARNGDVTFALNSIRDSHTGGKYQYQSEPGNELLTSIPSGNILVGWIYGQNNTVYLLSANGSDSEIGSFKDGYYTTHVTADLGFDPRFPITGEYRLKNGCENIIYWCDGNSPDGFYNFDRPTLFQDGAGNWDPNLFKLIPDVLPPIIDLVSVNDSGGILALGSYYFQIEILDETLNSIYKTDISPQTVIYDNSIGEPYSQIDGGLNIEQYTAEVGGVPLTNKSITLRISNLNTNLSFIRINVARQITATQVVDAHAVGTLIPIDSETITYTYKGYFPSSGDYPLDYSEMLIDNIRYDTAYVMEQVQGRLVRAALKQDNRDYSTYQQYASNLVVYWVSEEYEAENATSIGNAKNPETYWLKTSFQGDEVYALGIRYLHSDGTWSPVFHIPGRPPAFWDTQLITVVDNSVVPDTDQVRESDVLHLSENDFDTWNDAYIGSEIQRWKVFNTAYMTDATAVTHPYNFKGRMGYYEADETYPDIRDCDENLIWGTDYNADPITPETKVRHHRMPDRRLLPHYNDGWISPIGIQFQFINYPTAEVIGHQFCYVKRDDSTKTVLDSGWFAKADDNANLTITGTADIYGVILLGNFYSSPNEAGDPTQLTGQYGKYLSADILFNSKLYKPSHIKLNQAYDFTFTDNGLGVQEFDKLGGGSINIGNVTTDFNSLNQPDFQNYKVESQLFVPTSYFTTTTAYDVSARSFDVLSPDSVIKCASEIENIFDLVDGNDLANFYVYKKSNNKPYGSLFNLDYKYINYNYVDTGNIVFNTFYNGDCLIPRTLCTKEIFRLIGGDVSIDTITYTHFYEEREINSELRYEGLLPETTYYNNDGNFQQLLEKYAILQDDSSWDVLPDGEIINEAYTINSDYTKQSNELYKGILPITYNYCSDCIGEFNTRLIFSPKSFDEESFDLYRINKINDYIDLPGNRGQITGLKYKGNVLLVHCKEGTFILQPNPQSITTDTSNIYLTTGDFLGIPPAELLQTDIGYAGCQSKQHQCDTPMGWCWADQLRGQVFKYTNKLDELSNRNMSLWFNENLPSELQYAFYQQYQIEYSTTSTVAINSNGIGLILYYDPKYDRLILSKRDYLPIQIVDRVLDYGDVKYDFENNIWIGINALGETITVNFEDSAYWFENKSWTLSYSFGYDSWTSWHSYIPPFAFWDNFYYYTVPPIEGSLNTIYRHKHDSSYQTYYDTKYDFIIEYVNYHPDTTDFNAIYYNGYSLQWDNTNRQWQSDPTITFDRGLFYNFNQSTGLVTLQYINQHTNPYANNSFNIGVKKVIRTDNDYKISGLYDLATNVPVITSSWDKLQDYDGYIDLVSNNDNIDYEKEQYNLNNIKDKFVISRLFYKPDEDYKKVINIIVNNESTSIR